MTAGERSWLILGSSSLQTRTMVISLVALCIDRNQPLAKVPKGCSKPAVEKEKPSRGRMVRRPIYLAVAAILVQTNQRQWLKWTRVLLYTGDQVGRKLRFRRWPFDFVRLNEACLGSDYVEAFSEKRWEGSGGPGLQRLSVTISLTNHRDL